MMTMMIGIHRLTRAAVGSATVLLWTACAWAQVAPGVNLAAPVAPAAPAPPGPRIKFATPNLDLGKVSAGQTVKAEFVFTNVGQQTLEITDVRPGCGCTTASNYDRRVEPGNSGVVAVLFNSANFSGQVHKAVSVSCNDPTQPTVGLQFGANIWKPIDVIPTFAMFNPVLGAPTGEVKVVRIVNNQPEPIKLGPPVCTNQSFKTELKEIREGKEYELHVQTAPSLNLGTIMATITVPTSSSNLPLISITAYAIVQPVVTVAPSQIILPANVAISGTRQMLTVRNNGSLPLEVSEAAVNVPGVQVQVLPSVPGRLFTITLNFPTNFAVSLAQRMEVTVKTTHPQAPELKVPIIQMASLPLTPPRPTIVPGALQPAQRPATAWPQPGGLPGLNAASNANVLAAPYGATQGRPLVRPPGSRLPFTNRPPLPTMAMRPGAGQLRAAPANTNAPPNPTSVMPLPPLPPLPPPPASGQ